MTLSRLEAGRAPLADFNRWVDSLVTNYKREIERSAPIVDEKSWIAHVVQKEAIQNSADALDPTSADEWCVTFEMDDKLPPRFITITDKGTCGLTGRDIVRKDELDRLEDTHPQKYQEERWARFEALSFPNIDPIGRGSRGQGKWAFVGSSENKTVIYETLRKDTVYRVGGWLGEEQLIKKPLEGEIAKKLIENEFDLKPLEKIGTRIVIVKPKREFWEGFLEFVECPMARYIGETWWELLKNGASIVVRWRGHATKIETPLHYRDDFIEKNSEQKWVVRDFGLKWLKNDKVKIKELVVIFSKKIIPEDFRGIAIQRRGMKVRNFDVQTENPSITKEIADQIYGWISFNEEGEKELRAIEDTTHYDFSSSLGTFGYHVFGKNGWLAQEIRRFAEEKLGLGLKDKRKSERLDILAVNKLNKFSNLHKLGESGRQTGVIERPKSPRLLKEIRIKMPKPLFPHLETRRVEYGESVTEIKVSIANYSAVARKMILKFGLKTASPKVPERTLKEFVKKELVVEADSESTIFGPYKVTFVKDRFDDGTYALEAELVLSEGDVLDEKFGKGVVVDQERELIYLNVDPPTGKGLFEFIDRIEFKDETTLQYRVKEKDSKYRIEINTLHPSYKHVEETEDLLSDHLHVKTDLPNPLLDYEVEIGAEAIAHYDLKKDANLISDEKVKKEFIDNAKNDEKAFFIDAIDQASRIAQKIRYEVLGGK